MTHFSHKFGNERSQDRSTTVGVVENHGAHSERSSVNAITEILDRHVCQPPLPDAEVRPCCIRATVTAMMRAYRNAISSDADEALHYLWRWSQLSGPERDHILSF